MLWAWATMRHQPSAKMLAALERRMLACVDDFTPQDVANMLWSWITMLVGAHGEACCAALADVQHPRATCARRIGGGCDVRSARRFGARRRAGGVLADATLAQQRASGVRRVFAAKVDSLGTLVQATHANAVSA